MAIEINGKVYRNLTEQVAKNQEDIKELQDNTINMVPRVEELEGNVSELNQDVARALKTPLTSPSKTIIAGINTANSQVNLIPGIGLKIQGSTLNGTEIYECERDIDYDRYNETIPAMVGMSRYYNGRILDIQSVILTGYINSPNGSQLVTHDITRQLQSVPNGQTMAFRVGGVLTDIRDDNLELYHFIVNIRVDGTQFFINTARCITGASFQGAQLTSASTMTNVKVRSILSLPITVI